MSGKRGLSDDERAVWASVTRKLKPLAKPRKATLVAPPDPVPPPRSMPTKATPSQARQVTPAKPPAPPLATLSRRERQRVARGRDKIDARLDLHGHTQGEAHAALLQFLRRMSVDDATLVLVITGKSGVLRQQVPLWLALPEFRALVVSVDAAAIRHGGEGALYIRVRRGRG